MLSKHAITEYQSIYKKYYGTELTYKEAEQSAIKFLELFKVIYKPIAKQNIDNENS